MRKIISFIGLLALMTVIYHLTSVGLYASLFLPFPREIDIFTLAAISAYFLTVLLEMLRTKRLARGNVIVFYLLYFGFTVYTLFAPHRGMYGLNLNPLNIFQTQQDPLIVALNLLLFAPVGFLLKLRWRNLLLMALLIALIETTQFVLKIGFADINDWISNLISFILGTQLIKINKKWNVRLQ